ncbi:MerR family transcriptional regulator [Actinoplanes derwentensis]|uniref:MerR HTH family regulatory protein n=1 Tax=Actinoplanes derwentensis TaxID=113562 RepID=A0A1H1VNG9_9ACTN|nr:MerR family transcriptional regulator [Actinoplanes derwentensis]GID83636.1 transcriptional regulator [Actinoplanes derwentensis]SDS86458.1 MerR HTH family regulatory protein [Actinoplanes derwentensis]
MMHAPVEERLSAGILARRLGVAPTTLRTWHQRYGLGPSGHESGRHRRYTSHDVAALTVMAQLTTRGVPAAEAARQARRETTSWTADRPCGDPGTDAEARGLARAARRMDVLTLRETLAASVAGHGVVHTWHTMAGPAFSHIGHARYPETRKAIARRLLTRTLSEVFAAVPRPPAGTPVSVLLMAADHGRDVAALDALAAALAERGTASIHLGAGLCGEVIGGAVARARPAVVVLWCDGPGPMPAEILAPCIGDPAWRPAVVEAGRGRACPHLADAVAAVAGLVAA